MRNNNKQFGTTFSLGASAMALLAVYAMMFLPYLPNAQGNAGSDYSFYLPGLLAGYYWFLENGLSNIPWFSPAECGAFPFYPDPNGAYYSVPQFLTFVVSPLSAVRSTLLLFAVFGFCGFYCLMRRGFASSRTAALLSSAFFMFNGFFTYRILAGHLTFHAFMLLPVVAAMVIGAPADFRSRLARVSLASLCLAYMIHSGMNHVLPPVLLSITIILLLHAMMYGWRWAPWLNLAAAGALAIALFAGKLAAELALLANFPRDYYPLPGIRNLSTTVELAFRTLFFTVPANTRYAIVNSKWALDRHEWEYGISPAPLIFIACGAALGLINTVRSKSLPKIGKDRIPALIGMIVLLLLPLAINCYDPEWNKFLKSLPFFGSSSNLLRWFSVYIAYAVLLSGLVLDRFPLPESWNASGKKVLAMLGILVMLIVNLTTDRTFYAGQNYPVSTVETAWKAAAATHSAPRMENIEFRNSKGGGPNDGLTRGVSSMMCYQPIMGYRLEKFPVGQLKPGPVLSQETENINLKNPACYVFPAENQCKPGDHFPPEMRADVEAFINYKPFPFKQPTTQIVADYVSLFSLLTVTLIIASRLISKIRRWSHKTANAGIEDVRDA